MYRLEIWCWSLLHWLKLVCCLQLKVLHAPGQDLDTVPTVSAINAGPLLLCECFTLNASTALSPPLYPVGPLVA